MRRVLVTRPEPGATQTARRLHALGFSAVKLPLTEIVPVAVEMAAVFEPPAAVAITSANAIRHAPADLLASLAAIPCFAVGDRTAEAARQAGFTAVVMGPGDAEGLARELIGAIPTGPVAYLCGRVRLPVFESLLADARFVVHAVETYDAEKIGYSRGQVAAALGSGTLDAVLLHSSRTAEALVALIGAAPGRAHLSATTALCCLSEPIAAVIGGRLPGNIRIAAEPSEAALLSMLGDAC